MQIVHLPPAMVPLLNALRLGLADFEPQAEAFWSERQAAARWLEFHQAYSLDAEDEKDLENIAFLFRQVDEALDDLDLERLTPPLFQAIALMEQVGKRRDQPHFSQQPGVNDFILASAAFLQGRGQKRGVTERLPVLEEYYKNLRQLYRLRKDDLKPEVRPDFETGLKQFRASLDEARSALSGDDRERLHDSLARLSSAAGLLQHLVDWDRQDHLRHLERYARFNIPVVGSDLELALQTGRSVPREQWDRGVRNLTSSVLPRLLDFWNQVRYLIVLPVEQRGLLDQLDGGLERLEASIRGLLSDDLTAEEAVGEFEACCLHLHDLFSSVERAALRGDRLEGTAPGAYWQAALGVLAGSVPMVALEELLRNTPAPREVQGLFTEYLVRPDPELLRDALCVLAELVPDQVVVVSDTWGCGYCGFVNPLGQHPCRRCRASPSSSSSWEA